MIRLSDLAPTWSVLFTHSVVGNVVEGRAGMGITFLCPHCKTQPLGVWFANPIDGGPAAPDDLCRDSNGNIVRWQRIGDTFETLTLVPSIDTSQHGHWHGYIRNGWAA